MGAFVHLSFNGAGGVSVFTPLGGGLIASFTTITWLMTTPSLKSNISQHKNSDPFDHAGVGGPSEAALRNFFVWPGVGVGGRALYYVKRVALSGMMAPRSAMFVPKKATCCYSCTVQRLGSISCGLIATMKSDRLSIVSGVHSTNVGMATLPDGCSICFRGVCNRGRSRHAREMLTGTSPFAMRRLRGVRTSVFRLNSLLTSSFSMSIVGRLTNGKLITVSSRKCLHRMHSARICPIS